MPCKNGLIALEEEALPVISSRKKAIADVVVKVLSTYYKKRRISSKVIHYYNINEMYEVYL